MIENFTKQAITDIFTCQDRKKHFSSENNARDYLRINHKGSGDVFKCECGAGFRYNTKPKVIEEINLQHIDLDFCARSCFRKTRYVDSGRAAKSMHKYGINGRVYFCNACGGWHFTSDKRKKL